jgi:C4-dicarboxylate-specific signal transduction histidine kinase
MLIAGLLSQRRERQKAEIESRRSLAMAAHGDRQAVMAGLTGAIAHELNQPLSAILHNAEAAELMVEGNRATAAELRDILRDIRTEDERASEIVQRHRAMLRKHDLEKQSLDIHTVVRESLALVVRDAGERHVRIDADAPTSPCFVLGDRILLQQVVVNLLINAMDAMAAVPPGSRRVTVRQEVAHDRVEIVVRDSGPGLPAEIDGRLFEPFVTTKPHGTGIGLTITRSIIQAHGGTIAGGNNPDAGATFRFTIPRAPAHEGARQ